MRRNLGSVQVLGVVGVLALVLVLPIAVFLVGQNQNPNSQASKNKLISDGAPSGYVVEDAYVDSDTPTKSYGGEAYLWADGESEKITYIKLNLESLAGKNIQSAKLKLFVTHPSTAPVSIVNVNASSWASDSITYNVRPLTGPTITTFTAPNSGQWVEVDLTPFVQQNAGNVVSVAIIDEDPGGLGFNSLESPFNQIELVVNEN